MIEDFQMPIVIFLLSNKIFRATGLLDSFVNPERQLSAYALYDIGVLLPKLHHLLLAGLVCLARLFGYHGGHFAEGTWNRISSPGCRQSAEVAGNAGYQTNHPRWAADAPGLGRS
uniref:Uncharacterized protein n=1 Tax=Hyaloperonospora arabidopsidis (strain Emoy2) TaxID=559515 RepID=M4BU76_HYAAE